MAVTHPVAIAPQSPTPILAQTAPETSPEADALQIEAVKTVSHWAIAAGLLIGAIALSAGAYQYGRSKRWERIEFLRKAVKEFESDPEIWNALKILDFEEYRDYKITVGDKTITFRATNELLYEALASHKERVEKKSDLRNYPAVIPSTMRLWSSIRLPRPCGIGLTKCSMGWSILGIL